MKCSLGISNFLEEISATAAKLLQSCPTLCNHIDGSPPGSPVPGILQARILEWVVFLSLGDIPNPGIEPRSPTLQADSLPDEPLRKPKNTGAGSLFLLQCMKVKSENEVAQLCLTLSNPMDCGLPGSSVHGFSRQEY